jgi:hypothetical protein
MDLFMMSQTNVRESVTMGGDFEQAEHRPAEVGKEEEPIQQGYPKKVESVRCEISSTEKLAAKEEQAESRH